MHNQHFTGHLPGTAYEFSRTVGKITFGRSNTWLRDTQLPTLLPTKSIGIFCRNQTTLMGVREELIPQFFQPYFPVQRNHPPKKPLALAPGNSSLIIGATET